MSKSRLAVAGFLAPALLAALAVAGWPLLRTAGLAFTDARLLQPGAPDWVGLDNFAWLLRDPVWWRAVANTALFAAVSVALELALGLAFAMLLNAGLPGRGALRAAALIPWALPVVVAAQVWRWMFHDAYGVINAFLIGAGVLDEPVAWLAGQETAMVAVILTDVWKSTPFVTLILLAGLQSIPEDVYEAARVDGAGALRRFRHVTLPLLRPAIAVAVIFRLLDALRVFDLIYVMTSNSQATATVAVYARQQLVDFQDLGYGSAASVAIFVLVGTASVLLVAWLRPFEEAGR